MRQCGRFRIWGRLWSQQATALCMGMLLGLTASIVMADEDPVDKADRKTDADYYELMKVFVDTFEQIDRNYVEDVDRRELMEAAIKGMLEKLDPYSSYIGPKDLARFNQSVEQEFGGIGIQVQINPESKRLTVITPLPGTPAYKAGVRAGDEIMEILGKPTDGFSIQDAVQLLKGKPGEEVSIGVKHLGEEETVTLKMERAIIQVATVMGDHYKKADEWDFMLDRKEKIGYIRLSHFSRRTAEELREAVEQLKSEGMEALILDLRFNPGGLLDQATKIVDLFVESGVIVSTKGRNKPERVWKARKRGTFSGFPMAVLVNRFSASASEIVSAALQDHKRAIVIGERTWGKGSVQNVIELEGGDSALKLTTAGYHRPSGKNIHRSVKSKESDEWGVMPNEVLKFTDKEIRSYLEYRRLRDVISEDGPPESDFKDRQLARAIEAVREQLTGKKPADKDDENKPKAAAGTDADPADSKKAAMAPRLFRIPKSAAL